MPRRSGVPKRDVLPDPIYNSKVVTKLVNQIMYDGERGVAQKIVYGAFEIIENKMGVNHPLPGIPQCPIVSTGGIKIHFAKFRRKINQRMGVERWA